MADAPRFTVPVRLRCCQREGFGFPSACGAPAYYARPGGNGFPEGYYCPEHKRKGDLPIPANHLVNRVSIQAEIVFSGTSWGSAPAQTEAIERLQAVLERAGGVLNLVTVQSAIGRYEAPRSGPLPELAPAPPRRRA